MAVNKKLKYSKKFANPKLEATMGSRSIPGDEWQLKKIKYLKKFANPKT